MNISAQRNSSISKDRRLTHFRAKESQTVPRVNTANEISISNPINLTASYPPGAYEEGSYIYNIGSSALYYRSKNSLGPIWKLAQGGITPSTTNVFVNDTIFVDQNYGDSPDPGVINNLAKPYQISTGLLAYTSEKVLYTQPGGYSIPLTDLVGKQTTIYMRPRSSIFFTLAGNLDMQGAVLNIYGNKGCIIDLPDSTFDVSNFTANVYNLTTVNIFGTFTSGSYLYFENIDRINSTAPKGIMEYGALSEELSLTIINCGRVDCARLGTMSALGLPNIPTGTFILNIENTNIKATDIFLHDSTSGGAGNEGRTNYTFKNIYVDSENPVFGANGYAVINDIVTGTSGFRFSAENCIFRANVGAPLNLDSDWLAISDILYFKNCLLIGTLPINVVPSGVKVGFNLTETRVNTTPPSGLVANYPAESFILVTTAQWAQLL